MSLVARHLEAGGIATVIMGCAKDIVEHCGVPRFVWSDFPLGNSAGRPFEADSQRQTVELASGGFGDQRGLFRRISNTSRTRSPSAPASCSS